MSAKTPLLIFSSTARGYETLAHTRATCEGNSMNIQHERLSCAPVVTLEHLWGMRGAR